jgi:hypothetical protein
VFYLDDVALLDAPATDPAFDAIRTLSHRIAPLRQRLGTELDTLASAASNADAPAFDFAGMASDAEELEGLHAQLVGAIALYKASPAYQADATTAAMLDNWLAFSGEWASATLGAIPAGVIDAAKGTTDALAAILANTTQSVFKGLTPLILGLVVLGGLALYAVRQGEKTRTYRRYVA